MSLTAGDHVTPSVRLVRQLGAGAMGQVWIADHLALRTRVVVKCIAPELVRDEKSRERFSREAAAAAQVKSPHVVQTFDHGVTEQGVPFIIMELLEGEDLAARLAREPVLPPRDVVRIVKQVASALSRAHASGVVHRDIKPANIFLCQSDDGVFVKLLDFGVARARDPAHVSVTSSGAVVGTPIYMSPEQAVGAKEIDHRSDLWSIAVVAFQALTGRTPFQGESVGALAVAMHTQPLPVPSQVNPSLPAAVDAWFAKACARDIDERFASARELARSLARAFGMDFESSDPSLDAISIETSSSNVAPRAEGATQGNPPRSRRFVVAGVSLAAVIAIGAVVAIVATRSSSPSTPTATPSSSPSAVAGTSSSPSSAEAPPTPSVEPASVTAAAPASGASAPSPQNRTGRRPAPTTSNPRPTSTAKSAPGPTAEPVDPLAGPRKPLGSKP